MGVLLGVKKSLPEFTTEDFKNSGLMHLLVVSGSNVAIVLVAISFLFARLGRPISIFMSLLALIFFVAMTGGDAPVLRAALMGGGVALANILGRGADSKNILLLSALAFIIINPFIVLYSAGFHLSFLATLGIIILSPHLQNFFARINLTNFFGLRTVLAVSLSAQIFVLPVLSYNFGTFPLSGILANLVAEPIMVFTMAFSFLSILTGGLPFLIAKILAIPSFIFIESLLWVAKIFGQIPPIKINKPFSLCVLVLLIIFSLYSFLSDTAITKTAKPKN